MTAFVSSQNLVDPRTGQRRGPEIALAIQGLTHRLWCPLAPCEARDAVEKAVRKLEAQFERRRLEGIEDERRLVARQKEARELAARFGWDVKRLQFEVDRRSFGSFTLTLDGSSQQRDLYCSALNIAWEHRRNMAIAAE